MEIIVIDDGINEGYYQTGSLVYNLDFDKNGRIIERNNYDPFRNSHATTCAGILKKYAPDCILTSLKVLNGSEGSPKQLLNALDWCIQRTDTPLLINMSIGSSVFQDFDNIGTRISKLLSQGAVIVAALNNNGSYTVPACFGGVIGVATESSYRENEYRISTGGFCHADILASSRHILTDFQGKSHETRICNSYAAPLITAMLHNLIDKTKENNLIALVELLSFYGFREGAKELNIVRADFAFNFSSSGEKSIQNSTENFFFIRSEQELDQLLQIPGTKRKKVISYFPVEQAIKNKLQEKNCLYWEPDFYDQAVCREVTDQFLCSLPIIHLYGDIRMRHLTKELCKHFRQENYYARIVSERSDAFLLESDWIPKGIPFEHFWAFYEKTFHCDLILYYSQTLVPESDFQIFMKGDNVQCRAEELKEIVSFPYHNNTKLSEELFLLIEGYFDK